MQDKTLTMLDITQPEHVEVQIKSDGNAIWVNVDGLCRLRITRIATLQLVDDRPRDDADYHTEDYPND
jgi:hypothetical protein